LLLIWNLLGLLLSLYLLGLLHFLHQQDLLFSRQLLLLLVILRLAIRGQDAASAFLLLLLLGRVLLTVLVVEKWLLLLWRCWRPLLHARLVLRWLRLVYVLQAWLRGLQQQVLFVLGVELHLSAAHQLLVSRRQVTRV
jgi:hypothetical protein